MANSSSGWSRRARCLRILGGTLTALGLVALPVEAQTPISCGQTLSGSIDNASQQNAYTFDANAGEAVVVAAVATSGTLQAQVALYSPTGTQIPTSSMPNQGTSSTVLPATGTYTILVTDYFLNTTGTYNVSLNFTTGRCAAAIACGQTLAGTISGNSQANAYTFAANANEAVVVAAVASSGTLLAYARLYSPTGTLLASSLPNQATSNTVLPSTGTYTILVSDWSLNHTGGYNVSVTVVGQTCGPTRIIALSGDLAFGPVTVNTTATRTLTIGNTGDGTLTVSGITYPPGFSGAWSGTVAAGATQDVTVAFAPTALTSYGGTVTVNSDKTSGTDTIAASGTGTAAPTRIIGLSGDLAFGPVTVNTTATRTLTISNTGTGTLTVGGITYPPGFSGAWSSGQIQAGSVQNVTVTFAPTAVTSYGGTVAVNSDKTSGTDTIAVSGAGTAAAAPTRALLPAGDFDGDGKADPAVYRAAQSAWYINYTKTGLSIGYLWGAPGDVPVQGDYDGDGMADVAVFRPSEGGFYIVKSSGGVVAVPWGAGGDIPVPADYDGDGKTDFAVFRPSQSAWYIVKSSGGVVGLLWGTAGDVPVPADYDGDGKADIAVFRPSDSGWYIVKSSGGGMGLAWGAPGDLPVVGDFDGDHKADVGVFRASESGWYIIKSSTGGGIGFTWGTAGDVPVFGDFDGDGKADAVVFRESDGGWYVLKSSGGSMGLAWGTVGDLPV